MENYVIRLNDGTVFRNNTKIVSRIDDLQNNWSRFFSEEWIPLIECFTSDIKSVALEQYDEMVEPIVERQY